eukprot:6180645-Pleurochrysis_carterae.AAC.1
MDSPRLLKPGLQYADKQKQLFNSYFLTLIKPTCWKIIFELLPTSELPAAPLTVPAVAPPRRPLLPPVAMAYRP